MNPRLDESTIIENILDEFEMQWASLEKKLKIIPGKDLLASLNKKIQEDIK